MTGFPKSRAAGAALGLLVAAAGVLPSLMALDVIRTPDSDFGAPRWIVLLLVQPFVLVGLGIALHALGLPVRVFHVLGFAAGLVFVTGGALVWTWLLVFGDTGDSAIVGIGPVVLPLPAFLARPLNRVMVGIAAVLMVVIAVVMWYGVLRGKLRAP